MIEGKEEREAREQISPHGERRFKSWVQNEKGEALLKGEYPLLLSKKTSIRRKADSCHCLENRGGGWGG
jgi:hypothetical protein